MPAIALLQEITAKVFHSCRAEHLHTYNQFLTQKSEQATLAAVRIGESRHAFNTILCIGVWLFGSEHSRAGQLETLASARPCIARRGGTNGRSMNIKTFPCPQRARYVRSY